MTPDDQDAILAWCAAGEITRAGSRLGEVLAASGLTTTDASRLGELVEGVWWSSHADVQGLQVTVATVERAIECALGAGLAPLVLSYVCAVCEAAWELSWEHGPVLAVLNKAREAARRGVQDLGDAAAHEIEAAVASLEVLIGELHVESACSAGSLSDVVERAGATSLRAGTAWRLASTLPSAALRGSLTAVALQKGSQAAAISAAARAGMAALAGDPSGLDEAVGGLRTAEQQPWESEESASELRSHRAALQGIRNAAGRDWLRVDEGTITHVFPFGLRVDDHAAVVRLVKEHGAQWSLAGTRLDNAPTKLLLVDDIWRGEDPLRRRYEGTQLTLPDLSATIGGVPTALRVSIVISQVGNHHLRVELDLSGALPDVIAEACLMPLPEYGDLHELGRPLRFAALPDGPSWGRLCDFAGAALTDLADSLGRAGLGARLSFRPGMYHVVSEVRRASALPGGNPDAARRLEDAAELPDLFGASVLCTALPSGVGSIADWAIDGAPRGTVVPTSIAAGTLLMASTNQTLIASCSAPSFMLGSLHQAVEFVASLEGMFAAWQDELSEFQTTFAPYLVKFAEAGNSEVDSHEVEADVSTLERLHVRLRRYVTAARISLLFIESPALVSSPVVRQTVSDLLALSPVWARRHDFTHSAGEALSERFEDLIQAWDKRRSERIQARNRILVETMLAVVAGIGISGIASIVQAGFDLRGWLAFVLVAAVLALAVVAGMVAFTWLRDPFRTPKGKTPPPRGSHERS